MNTIDTIGMVRDTEFLPARSGCEYLRVVGSIIVASWMRYVADPEQYGNVLLDRSAVEYIRHWDGCTVQRTELMGALACLLVGEEIAAKGLALVATDDELVLAPTQADRQTPQVSLGIDRGCLIPAQNSGDIGLQAYDVFDVLDAIIVNRLERWQRLALNNPQYTCFEILRWADIAFIRQRYGDADRDAYLQQKQKIKNLLAQTSLCIWVEPASGNRMSIWASACGGRATPASDRYSRV